MDHTANAIKDIQCAPHCFPIKKAGRQFVTHMIARPSIKKTLTIDKQPDAHGTYSYIPHTECQYKPN